MYTWLLQVYNFTVNHKKWTPLSFLLYSTLYMLPFFFEPFVPTVNLWNWEWNQEKESKWAIPTCLWWYCYSWADVSCHDCEIVCEVNINDGVFALLCDFFVFNIHYTPGCTMLFTFLETLLNFKCKSSPPPTVAHFMAALFSHAVWCLSMLYYYCAMLQV